MQKLPKLPIVPSAAFPIHPKDLIGYEFMSRKPEMGDVVYGQIMRIGAHSQIENKSGRLHNIVDGMKNIFVFGNRYATDYFEGYVPEDSVTKTDLLARSGIVGEVVSKNSMVKDPTRVKILGYVLDKNGKVVNTRNYGIDSQPNMKKKDIKSKLILFIGTGMNSGKSTTASAFCRAISLSGHKVVSSKITGTASLKDILNMEDMGAEHISDFTYLGYPSTFKLDMDNLRNIYQTLGSKYATDTKKYWAIEIADGILQRETSMLLKDEYFISKIDKVIFSAADPMGAIAGIRTLKEEFGITSQAISGKCSGSRLMIEEIEKYTQIPILDNINIDVTKIMEVVLG